MPLHLNHNRCIPSDSLVFIHLEIQSHFQLPHLSFFFVSLALKYDPSPTSNYIWNIPKLLLLSGDVKINPGLRTIDQNPVFCSIRSNKVNRGIRQDTAPTCSNENCNAQYNGLSIN